MLRIFDGFFFYVGFAFRGHTIPRITRYHAKSAENSAPEKGSYIFLEFNSDQ